MIFDSHMHTEVSADSAMKAEDALERAAKLGIGAVFTEHEDMDFPGEKDFTFSPEDYWKKYEALRGKGERLRLGVELGMQEGLAEKNRAFLLRAPFDQVIGSIHTLLGFDLYYETLYEGREKDEVYRLYLRAMASCVRSHGDFIDILAHIDYIAQCAGIEHTAIGLDYCYDDGVPDIPADVNRQYWWPPAAGYDPQKGLSGKYLSPAALDAVRDGLAQRGYRDDDIRAIMRDNLLALIKRVW